MNPLFNKFSNRPQNPNLQYNNNLPQSNQQINMQQLLQFIKTTSPDQAKRQVEQIIRERGLSPTEVTELQKKAQDIANFLGMK